MAPLSVSFNSQYYLMFLYFDSFCVTDIASIRFTMDLLFPSQDTLHDVFHPAIPFGRRPALEQKTAPLPPRRTRLQARSELYPTWSVVDDAKNKASALSTEAQKEFDKASAAAQAKTGHIELYSAQYYAACTFGGLLACVCSRPWPRSFVAF